MPKPDPAWVKMIRQQVIHQIVPPLKDSLKNRLAEDAHRQDLKLSSWISRQQLESVKHSRKIEEIESHLGAYEQQVRASLVKVRGSLEALPKELKRWVSDKLGGLEADLSACVSRQHTLEAQQQNVLQGVAESRKLLEEVHEISTGLSQLRKLVNHHQAMMGEDRSKTRNLHRQLLEWQKDMDSRLQTALADMAQEQLQAQEACEILQSSHKELEQQKASIAALCSKLALQSEHWQEKATQATERFCQLSEDTDAIHKAFKNWQEQSSNRFDQWAQQAQDQKQAFESQYQALVALVERAGQDLGKSRHELEIRLDAGLKQLSGNMEIWEAQANSQLSRQEQLVEEAREASNHVKAALQRFSDREKTQQEAFSSREQALKQMAQELAEQLSLAQEAIHQLHEDKTSMEQAVAASASREREFEEILASQRQLIEQQQQQLEASNQQLAEASRLQEKTQCNQNRLLEQLEQAEQRLQEVGVQRDEVLDKLKEAERVIQHGRQLNQQLRSDLERAAEHLSAQKKAGEVLRGEVDGIRESCQELSLLSTRIHQAQEVTKKHLRSAEALSREAGLDVRECRLAADACQKQVQEVARLARELKSRESAIEEAASLCKESSGSSFQGNESLHRLESIERAVGRLNDHIQERSVHVTASRLPEEQDGQEVSPEKAKKPSEDADVMNDDAPGESVRHVEGLVGRAGSKTGKILMGLGLLMLPFCFSGFQTPAIRGGEAIATPLVTREAMPDSAMAQMEETVVKGLSDGSIQEFAGYPLEPVREATGIQPMVLPLAVEAGDEMAISYFRYRRGVLLEGRAGEPVLAAADGEVVYAGDDPNGRGSLLIVRHEAVMTVYGHLEASLVVVGDQVKAGQPIATLSGISLAGRQGLYFEVRHQGHAEDPYPYFASL